MKASEVIAHLKTLIHEHGDVEVHAYPGFDTSYPVTPQTIDYYSEEITGRKPFILISGDTCVERDL